MSPRDPPDCNYECVYQAKYWYVISRDEAQVFMLALLSKPSARFGTEFMYALHRYKILEMFLFPNLIFTIIYQYN